MSVLDFIFSVIVVIATLIGFIGWLGLKYDIVGRDENTENLKKEILRLEQKEARRKKRNRRKKKGVCPNGK